MFKYSQEFLDKLILDIYYGVVTVESLPLTLYTAISDTLLGAFEEIKGSPSQALLQELSDNLHLFSGAKLYQQINDISLLTSDGMIKNFKDFKTEALKIHERYNQNWLQTEYSTTVAQAQNAVRWEQIQDQKQTLPYLMYSAVIDKNTSDICRPLNGVTRPVDDPFWKTNTPVNHWNCRCTLQQFDKEDAIDFGITSDKKAEAINTVMGGKRQELFNNNIGMTKEIFPKSHPYFDIPKKDIPSAKVNFGLPVPKVPEVARPFIPAKNPAEAKARFKNSIESNSAIRIKRQTFDSSLSMESINVRLEANEILFKDYNISPVIKGEETSLMLKGSRTAHGYIERARFYGGEYHISKINYGHTTDNLFNRTFDPLSLKMRAKSAVDAVNLEKATTYHEFAHILGTLKDTEMDPPEWFKVFFKDLGDLRKSYTEQMNGYIRAGEFKKLNEISLGQYSHKNLNEFMAEGFTEYKLKTDPSEFAKKIGVLIDKNFKR